MQYPIRLHVKDYKGTKPEKVKELQRAIATANQIAEGINGKLSLLPSGSVVEYDYTQLAEALGMNKEVVKRILTANGGGSHGVTLRK